MDQATLNKVIAVGATASFIGIVGVYAWSVKRGLAIYERQSMFEAEMAAQRLEAQLKEIEGWTGEFGLGKKKDDQ